jgi:GT2 family glycosyltransferase
MEETYSGNSSTIKLSVIILTWNSEKYLEKCIDSIYASVCLDSDSIEVIVVDNGSSDATPEILGRLRSNSTNFACILLDKNYGTTFSRNLAIKKSKGDFVLVLDSDTEITGRSIDILLETLNDENCTNVGIVGPRLLLPDGSVQHSCKKIPSITMKIFNLIGNRYLRSVAEERELYGSRVYSLEFHETVEVDYCISACWLVRREALDEVGLFDEKIFYAPEDIDLCVRMWLKGWKVVYNPNAIVIHHTQRLSRRSFRFALSLAEGLFYYFGKYGYWFRRERLYKKFKNYSGK